MERENRPRGIVRACITGLLVLLLPLAGFPQSEKKPPAQSTQIVQNLISVGFRFNTKICFDNFSLGIN